MESGGIGGIVVAKLDRLSRSLKDFALLMERAQKRGWNLVACDLGIDLSSPSGEFMAGVMSSAAQWERRIIGQRTKYAPAGEAGRWNQARTPACAASEGRRAHRGVPERRTGLVNHCPSVERRECADGPWWSRWHALTVRAVALSNRGATDTPNRNGLSSP